MKKWALLVVLCLAPILVNSAGLRFDQITPVERDDGDSPIFINVACDPTLWTSVVSSDTIRRSLYIESDYQVQNPVCLGTAPIGSNTIQCNTATQALIIGTATVPGVSLFTKNAWTCRTAGATGVQTGTLHGLIGRDKHDYGNIGDASVQ